MESSDSNTIQRTSIRTFIAHSRAYVFRPNSVVRLPKGGHASSDVSVGSGRCIDILLVKVEILSDMEGKFLPATL